jgi:hypothetical protein
MQIHSDAWKLFISYSLIATVPYLRSNFRGSPSQATHEMMESLYPKAMPISKTRTNVTMHLPPLPSKPEAQMCRHTNHPSDPTHGNGTPPHHGQISFPSKLLASRHRFRGFKPVSYRSLGTVLPPMVLCLRSHLNILSPQ